MNKNRIKSILLIITISLSLLIPDIGIRLLLYKEINFVPLLYLPAFIFTISYILIILFIYYLKPKLGKIIYIVFTIIFNIYTFAQILHFKILDRIFTVTDILVADQATNMVGYILRQIKFIYILIIILSIFFLFISLKLMKETKMIVLPKKKKILVILLAIILVLSNRFLAILSLGDKVSDDAWNFWNTEKNVYIDYDSPSRSFIISGIYEYCFRDIYTYFRDFVTDKKNDDIKEINDYINSLNYVKEENEYTGIFKDKNVIMIMLESIDSWLVNEEVMPTLTNIKNTGINFTNRYSPTFGGGSTINTEFASLTGLYATVTNKPIFRYDENNFDYSLPNLFKNNGYSVNSVHMNTGSFYNRDKFHLTLGFENHYAMTDLVEGVNFQYDTNLIKNEESYSHIINKNNKFLNFITTYSAHVPYINNELCDSLDTTPFEIKDDEETTCLRTLANETDNFIKLLIESLKQDNLLDDTIIVLYTDHYTYGYSDTSKWTNIKDTKLSQNTTFVIWNPNLMHKDIDIYCDTVDIPVTLFNMFGIDYNPNIYMGTDVFSKNHEQFVYFNDYSWVTSDMYYTGSVNNYDLETIEDISNRVNNKIRINEKIINSNFYKYYN